ncbi:MAG: branched-chain amino acid aminotransferase [Epsilonproteobacteria bacterium]|nr:MAG: branched-chain amino acid aminotransferase [Campylobacterota bacterium]
MSIKIHPDAITALRTFSLPEKIGFGSTISPVMMDCEYKDGNWGELEMVPYGPLTLSPTCKVFHYAQEIFEGLKAYRINNKGPFLFRHIENFKRFNQSATRMAIPELPEEIFMKAVEGITAYSADFIPGESGSSLYIRPFIIATEENLGIKPSAKYRFMVIASPSASYFSSGSLKVLIERHNARAFTGGTGAAKTGGNYAASLSSSVKAAKLGYMNTLWLDAENSKYIEEMSGMNFFAVVNGALVTPKLTDTILAGITRNSIITLAKNLNIPLKEETINIDSLIESIKLGECSEAFACGTAAIITPIELFGEDDGTTYKLKHPIGPISKSLKENLLAIQEGRMEGPEGWIKTINPATY